MPAVIEVKGLSKKYRIGNAEKRADTVMGAIINGIQQPFQNLKQIRSLSKLDEDEESIFWALRDVSFEVKEGEVLGIIGHNGAGKSTLLKILSRITEPSEGEVHIKGRVAALLEVGTGFHPELTGRENIYMNGTILGMRKKEIDTKLDEIVDFSGVEKYLDTPVKFYSSGMRVRLGFSVAAHLEPEILIIDEVLAVGDAEFQSKCLGRMKTVANAGRTVLFVSHNMAAVSALCSSTIVLSRGTSIFNGVTTLAIREYLQQGELADRSAWKSISGEDIIRGVKIALEGKQPHLLLKVQITISVPSGKRPAFIALDIKNSFGVTIMQAIPNYEPFINTQEDVQISVKIELSGLIPDIYSVSVWVGPHNNETYDFKEDIVMFQITDNPSSVRTFPHSLDHGNIVPNSYLI